MTTPVKELNRTPLHQAHLDLQAKLVDFGGWELPVQYRGILEEYRACREDVAIFDISHMGEIFIQGDPKETGLDQIVTQNLTTLKDGASRYGMMLNEQGGVVDDLIVFRLREEWMLVVNAATREKDVSHLKNHLLEGTRWSDRTFETGKIDVQGPRSRDLLQRWIPGLDDLRYFRCFRTRFLGHEILISRTGYTGELGYELFIPWHSAPEIWQALVDEGAVPAGLGARDVLRLEMGYSLYGHEIHDKISPLKSGLERFIDFQKSFIGKSAVEKERDNGVEETLCGLVSSSRRAPRQDFFVFSPEGREIGRVTSGTFSPSQERGIGLARVLREFADPGTKVMFGNEKSAWEAEVSPTVFYHKGSLKT